MGYSQEAAVLGKLRPNCTHVVLDGMGHMLAFENPQRLGDELLKFLSSC